MKFCVIGIGRFGYRVATTLAENGMEVLVVDNSESLIASIRDHVTQAICMKIEDEASLRSIGIEEMDTVIVAIGENFAQSILVTAILKKKLKTPRVITRSIGNIHEEILKLVGADMIILPEQTVAIQLADRLSLPFTSIARLTNDYSIGIITSPEEYMGKTVQELKLYEQYAITFLGVMKNDSIEQVPADYVIEEGNKLVCAGSNKSLSKITKA
ncbi:MAG: TrkA family potassium uptake protein [Candidatus Babeliales bacterium]